MVWTQGGMNEGVSRLTFSPFLSIRCGLLLREEISPSPPHVSAFVCMEDRTSLSPLPPWGEYWETIHVPLSGVSSYRGRKGCQR